jgi:hypothetical protein
MGRLYHPEPHFERRYGPAIDLIREARSKDRRRGRDIPFLTVAVAEELIDILRATPEALSALQSINVDHRSIRQDVRVLLRGLHANRQNDHYVTLLLPRTASREEITHRWKALMLLYHPDRGHSEEVDDGLVKRINGAYQVLKDPDARARYDQTQTQKAYMLTVKGGGRGRGRQRDRRVFLRLMVTAILLLCCIVAAAVIVFDRRTEAYRLEQAARDTGATDTGVDTGVKSR